MKPFFKYFLCSIILFSIGTQAQNERKYSGLFYYKNSRNSGLNLKDSVKTIYFKFNKPKESLSSSEISHAILFNDVRMSSVVYFDEFQRMKFTVDDILGYDYLSFNQKKSNEYEYSGEKDRQEKSKYKSALKHYFPVWDCNLQLYLNHSLAPSETYTFEEDGKIWYNYLGYIYIYI